MLGPCHQKTHFHTIERRLSDRRGIRSATDIFFLLPDVKRPLWRANRAFPCYNAATLLTVLQRLFEVFLASWHRTRKPWSGAAHWAGSSLRSLTLPAISPSSHQGKPAALSDKTPNELYISSGELHGFLTQAASRKVFYQMSNCVQTELDQGIDRQGHPVVIA